MVNANLLLLKARRTLHRARQSSLQLNNDRKWPLVLCFAYAELRSRKEARVEARPKSQSLIRLGYCVHESRNLVCHK